MADIAEVGVTTQSVSDLDEAVFHRATWMTKFCSRSHTLHIRILLWTPLDPKFTRRHSFFTDYRGRARSQ
jgi:hypothetical protein